MEQLLKVTTNGTEITLEDINLLGDEAARGTDWLLAELLRPSVTNPSVPGSPFRYVIPGGARRDLTYAKAKQAPLITSSNLSNGRVHLYPFMAVIGSLDLATVNAKNAIRKIRTVGYYGADDNQLHGELLFGASVNKRWDLVYAKIDVDVLDGAVVQYIKAADESISAENVQKTRQTKLTISIEQGAESAGTPTRPSLPADSASTVYIALAYVYIPAGFDSTTSIPSTNIHEVYDTIGISPALGTSRMQPANQAFKATGYAFANETSNPTRPKSYLPAGMVGEEKRLIPLHCADSGHGTRSIPANTSTLVDDSIDWRRRLFKSHFWHSSSGDGFPWCLNSPPDAVANAWNNVGATGSPGANVSIANSFLDMGTAYFSASFPGFPSNSSVIMCITDSQGLATGAVVILFVDLATGYLMAWRNNVDAGKLIMVWLESTAPYYNFQPSGD